MTPNETTQLRTMAEVNRRLRRENERLREALLQQTEASKQFDAESEMFFQLVKENREKRCRTWHVKI